MPNGIVVGPTVFTQWRTQQGGSTASEHRLNTQVTGDVVLRLHSSYKLMELATSSKVSTGVIRNFERFVLSEVGLLGNAAGQNNA